ncbi:ADP-ribosylglycohydrolase family protein [Bradyrhizobium sp.]|uniref:ADP-ribosylglycohydrolase family protein n=1 Tax=Bradyrhizobium sp. TaxID=376 RepID=UPI00261CC0E0|nr:ADP-ribosylglycohydrolase family protein [Bradyrhizobium sp.]
MIRAGLQFDTKKIEGALLGAALGDALGWPHEDRARRASTLSEYGLNFEAWTKRSGGRFQPHEERIEPGSYSDDTQLIIAVARSRLREGPWWEYLAFVEFPFWIAYSRGAGGASLRAAKLLANHILPWEGPTSDKAKYLQAGGNGAAMRVAAHCVLGYLEKDFRSTATNVMADSVLTHGHPTGLVGALAYAYALWTAFRRKGTLEFGQLLETVRTSSDEWSQIPELSERWPSWEKAVLTQAYRNTWSKSANDLSRQLEEASAGLIAGALDFDDEVLSKIGCFDKKMNGAGTVSAAAAIFLSSKYAAAPTEGIARAAFARGADTDTIASMTGAIAGAINGTDWLLQFTRKLQDESFLANLARSLEDRLNGRELPYPTASVDTRSLLSSLTRGEKSVTLPTGAKAHVIGDGGVVSKSDKIRAASWKLEDEFGQTFIIKQLKKETNRHSATQVTLNLDLTTGTPHGKFAGISLFARNLEESRRFYCEFLGLPAKRDTQTLVALGDHLVLRQNDLVRAVGEGSIVYVGVDNIETCWNNLRSIKYANVSSIERRTSRSSFTCKDPDGRTVEVFQR